MKLPWGRAIDLWGLRLEVVLTKYWRQIGLTMRVDGNRYTLAGYGFSLRLEIEVRWLECSMEFESPGRVRRDRALTQQWKVRVA